MVLHQVLEYNKRIQAQNRVPRDFPWFVREGFDVKILADDFEITPEGCVCLLTIKSCFTVLRSSEPCGAMMTMMMAPSCTLPSRES